MDDYQAGIDSFGDQPPDAGSMAPALFAGIGAALTGGILWAIVVAVTGYELGYVAWAIGALVGFAMSRATSRRGTAPAALAAVLALSGLLAARVIIGEYVLAGSAVQEVMEDDELMAQALVFDMQMAGSFPADIQQEFDLLADDDTLSDALWGRMLEASASRLAGMDDGEREVVARQFTMAAVGSIGFAGRLTSQLSPFDLLWVLLAVSTAWSMLKKPALAEAQAQPDD